MSDISLQAQQASKDDKPPSKIPESVKVSQILSFLIIQKIQIMYV